MPSTEFSQTQIRPALVVSKDLNNARLNDVIIVPFSSNLNHSYEPTQHLLVGKELITAGIRVPSVIRCEAILVIPKSLIVKKLGKLSPMAMQYVDRGLKDALGLSSK
jgi:mRNA interferase MazF